MLTLSIRNAAGTDEDNVVALWHACGLVTSYNDPAQDFRFARAKPNSDIPVGVSPEGRIVAVCTPGRPKLGSKLWMYAPISRTTSLTHTKPVGV